MFISYPIESIGEENITIKHNEDMLRKLFAVDRDHVILNDPYVHLLSVFDVAETFAAEEPVKSIPLMFDFENPEYFNSMELTTHLLGQAPPKPQLATSKSQFFENWNAYTACMLQGLDWGNIFIAGGSVYVNFSLCSHF